jgi:cyclopropane fatty-acyl-phospholipid synthase-like methyltransferase
MRQSAERMHDQSRRDWARFAPEAIPTKTQLPQLTRWLDGLDLGSGTRVLDLGCGAGEVTRRLVERGCDAVGVDVNAAAIAHCERTCSGARFYERDIAGAHGLALAEPPFDAVVCQLVISVVGDASDRAQLLRNAYDVLRRGGGLFVSFSGLSDDVNDAYAALYARDFDETRSHGTYLSRDADGRVLYRTHHFGEAEIEQLLERAGFEDIALETQIEASSRRPDQRARFYYATCRRD